MLSYGVQYIQEICEDNLRGKLRNVKVVRKIIVQRYLQLAAFRDWSSCK